MGSKEQEEVSKANQAFYRAFESLDIRVMQKVWARENYVQCTHPGWGVLRGWEPVIESWRGIFENTRQMRFTLTEVKIEIRNSLAWVTLYEKITSQVGDEIVSGVVCATNIFEKRPEGWLIIHHHGSTVVPQPREQEPPTVH